MHAIDDTKNTLPFEKQKYFYHYGAMAYLANLFKITDLHKENIICSDSIPVMIDAETAFHPEIPFLVDFDFASTKLFPSQWTHNSPIERYQHSDYIAMVKGATVLSDCIKQHRVPILELVQIYLNETRRRVILKPTHFYLKVLKQSCHPSLLIDPEKRLDYIKSCLVGHHPITKMISESECASITNFDVPYFFCCKDQMYDLAGTIDTHSSKHS